MPTDPELDEVDRKIKDAKAAAAEERESRPFHADDGDELAAPEPAHAEDDEGFSPT
jgi:hypothetical protein